MTFGDGKGVSLNAVRLCTFTTAGPGELNLILYMDYLDLDDEHVVTTQAQAPFVVQGE